MVFLHGYNEGNWVWEFLIPKLPQQWSCHCIELPGFGNAEDLPAELKNGGEDSMDRIANLIWNKLEGLGIHQPWIVGHSLGGYVALAMACSRPADLSGIILFHSSPFADSVERKSLRDKVIRLVGDNGAAPFLEAFAAGLFREKSGHAWNHFCENLKTVRPESITAYAAIMRDRPDRSECLRNLPIPVGMIAGRHDALMPVSILDEIKTIRPGLQAVILEGSAHVGMLEEPEAGAAALKTLITG